MLLAVMWSTSFMFIAIAVKTVPPLAITVTRLLLGGGVVAVLMFWMKLRLPRDMKSWAYLVPVALFGNALPFFLISWGMTEIPSGLSGLLMGVNPLITILLARFFTDDGQLTPSRILGLMSAFGGVAVLMAPSLMAEGVFSGQSFSILHLLAVLGGAACFAVNAILARRMPPQSPFVSGTISMLVAAFVMLPVMLAVNPIGSFEPSSSAVLAIAVQGIWCTALPTLVYFRLIGRTGPVFISTINYVLPLLTLLWGMMFLGERPGTNAFLALVLVVIGLALANKPLKRAADPSPEKV